MFSAHPSRVSLAAATLAAARLPVVRAAEPRSVELVRARFDGTHSCIPPSSRTGLYCTVSVRAVLFAQTPHLRHGGTALDGARFPVVHAALAAFCLCVLGAPVYGALPRHCCWCCWCCWCWRWRCWCCFCWCCYCTDCIQHRRRLSRIEHHICCPEQQRQPVLLHRQHGAHRAVCLVHDVKPPIVVDAGHQSSEYLPGIILHSYPISDRVVNHPLSWRSTCAVRLVLCRREQWAVSVKHSKGAVCVCVLQRPAFIFLSHLLFIYPTTTLALQTPPPHAARRDLRDVYRPAWYSRCPTLLPCDTYLVETQLIFFQRVRREGKEHARAQDCGASALAHLT